MTPLKSKPISAKCWYCSVPLRDKQGATSQLVLIEGVHQIVHKKCARLLLKSKNFMRRGKEYFKKEHE